jgi:hypothetical protein
MVKRFGITPAHANRVFNPASPKWVSKRYRDVIKEMAVNVHGVQRATIGTDTNHRGNGCRAPADRNDTVHDPDNQAARLLRL